MTEEEHVKNVIDKAKVVIKDLEYLISLEEGRIKAAQNMCPHLKTHTKSSNQYGRLKHCVLCDKCLGSIV